MTFDTSEDFVVAAELPVFSLLNHPGNYSSILVYPHFSSVSGCLGHNHTSIIRNDGTMDMLIGIDNIFLSVLY